MLDALFTKLDVLAKECAIYLIVFSVRNIFRQTTPASVHD
ncbi:MAG: hypothetical protein LZF60_80454 [Nitrospira sp.]|nr:MAG: hypothetical protein LZF60_80454 [Nitrospira sp.]